MDEIDMMSKVQLMQEVRRLASQLSEAYRKLESYEAKARESEGLLRCASPEVEVDCDQVR